ncbi:MAG TPA: LuxR C-terminal-related transcriptional regulator [Acidimicrobiia bacterium]
MTEALNAAAAGHGNALIVRGEAGLGKSTLLHEAVVAAAGFRVATVAGEQLEQGLSYAGLHRLFVTMLDRIDTLPAPQRNALAAALGTREGMIDPFLVGLAVMGLLSEMSAGEPFLCVIDDAQWMDAASMQALAFVARRLGTERVALMFGVVDTADELAGLPEVLLRPLSDADAHDLVVSVVPGPLCPQVADRIVEESQGNPRVLLALLRSFSPEQLAGGFGLPVALPAGDPLVATLRSRLDGLGTDTRELLLVAAAEPEGDLARFWGAVERLDLDHAATDEAVALGLLGFGTRVTFLQPQLRSLVYHDALPADRRAVHRALAGTTEPEQDVDRRAWHEGHAALGMDAPVADALERSATNAQVLGGFAAAAAFLERSALLTSHPDRRAQRALLAARAKFEAGSVEAASQLLTLVNETSLDQLEHARLQQLRAEVVAQRRGSEAPPLLLDVARALEQLDVQLARDTYLQTLEAALVAGRLGAHRRLVEAALAGRGTPRSSIPCGADCLLDGLALLITDGHSAAQPALRRAVQAFRSEDDTRWLGLACRAAAEVWDADATFDLATRWTQLSRDTGALIHLPMALNFTAGLHVHAGEFETAAALVEEATSIVTATDLAPVSHGALVLAAWSGRELRTSELIEAARRDALTTTDGLLLSLTEYSAAVLANGLGRYHDALDALQSYDDRDGLVSNWILPELVEAAVRSGEHALAASAAEELTVRTEAAGTEWALGFQARSSALLTDGPAAEKRYREAIERFGRCRASGHLARAHLLYGEWLRRERRRLEAREQLRLARDMFSTMGAAAFAQRAERELFATGERARRRSVETVRHLTPQELEIARLASTGESNPEIAVRLFISARTVEYHLHKVFTKLDIRSRTQLAVALDGDTRLSRSPNAGAALR